MMTVSLSGAPASTASDATPPISPNSPLPAEQVRHLLFGTPSAVQTSIRHLHKLGYAEANDWSRPISTGRAGEVMAILTKRLRN